MRPTVDEQLQGMCRIMQESVLPGVADAHAREVLRGVISNLSMLSEALPRLDDFFRWDNDRTRDLLRAVEAPAKEADPQPRQDASSVPDLDGENARLRAELSAVIRSGALDDAAMDSFRRHLIERSRRTPIRYATVLPSSSATKEK